MTTVLIADDEMVERQYLCRLFNSLPGFTLVGEAENGGQAVALATKYTPDVIIMDINMPMSGLDAAAAIRRRDPAQIIIINTAYADFGYARQAVELHLDAYFLKPATSEEVLSTVESCLRHRGRNAIGSMASARTSLAYPHEIVEAMLSDLDRMDPELFSADSQAYLEFMDHENGWQEWYHLYLINTAFSLGQRLNRLGLREAIVDLVGCDECISRLSCAMGSELRRISAELFRRITLALRSEGSETSDPVETVCNYIHKHYDEALTLELLAGLVHFNPDYLSRIFHRKTGVTLRNYILKTRVDNAARMLRLSRRGISDIALDCGFKNISHFHRVFKEQLGITPNEARKMGEGVT